MSGTEVATRDQYEAPEGLEDLDQSDLSVPRLTIDHKIGQFVDSLSGQKYSSIDVVVLGLVKQKILWPPELSEGKEAPLCRSLNDKVGLPNPKTAPWQELGVAPGTAEIDCSSCPLIEWGSHPKRETSWCSQQFVLPLLVLPSGAPAIVTFQRSALKPAKAFLTTFKRDNVPAFSVQARITLEMNKRGSVDYAVPKFEVIGESDKDKWGEYSTALRGVREFLQTPRQTDDDEAVSAAPAAPAPAPAAVIDVDPVDDDGDLPF